MRPKFIAEAVHTAASDIVPNTVVRCHRVNTIPYHHPKVNSFFQEILRVLDAHPQPFHQLIVYNVRSVRDMGKNQYIVKHYQTLHLKDSVTISVTINVVTMFH